MTGRERDLDRLLTFVDAVVAIAITRLVLPLTEVDESARNGPVIDLLQEEAGDLLGFFLSFAVIARLWVAQHAIVGPLVRQNPPLVRLLIAWTLTVVFLPFPTSLVTAESDEALVKLLYIGTMAVNSALLALIARVVARDRELRDTDDAPDPVHAAAFSVAIPVTGYWPLLLLLVAEPVAGRLRRVWHARRRTAV